MSNTEDRKLLQARDPQIPGLLVHNEWRGTFDEFEEAVEFGELDLFLKIDPNRLKNDTQPQPTPPVLPPPPTSAKEPADLTPATSTSTITNGQNLQSTFKSNVRTPSHSVKSIHRLAQPRAPSQTSLAPALPFAPSGSGSRKERDAESFLSSLGLSDLNLTEEELNEILKEGQESRTMATSQVEKEEGIKSTSIGGDRGPGKYPESLGIGTSKPIVPRTYIPSAEAGIKPLRLARMGNDNLRSSSTTSPLQVSPSARFNASQLSSKALAAEAQASITSRSFSSIKVREAVSRGDKLEEAFDIIRATSRANEKENVVGRENIDDLMASLGLNNVKMSEEEAEAFLLDGSIPKGLDSQGSRLGRTGSIGERARNEVAAKDVAMRAKEKGYGGEHSKRTSIASSTGPAQAEVITVQDAEQVKDVTQDIERKEEKPEEAEQDCKEKKIGREQKVAEIVPHNKIEEDKLEIEEQQTRDVLEDTKEKEAGISEETIPPVTDAGLDSVQVNNLPQEAEGQPDDATETTGRVVDQLPMENKATLEHRTSENLLESTDTGMTKTVEAKEELALKVEVQGPSDDVGLVHVSEREEEEEEAVVPLGRPAITDKEPSLTEVGSSSAIDTEAQEVEDMPTRDHKDGEADLQPVKNVLDEKEKESLFIPVEIEDKSVKEVAPEAEGISTRSLLQDSKHLEASLGANMSPPLQQQQPPPIPSKSISPSNSQINSPSDLTKSPSTGHDSLSPTPMNLSPTSPRRTLADPSLTPSRRAMDLSRKMSSSSSLSEATSPISSSRPTASSPLSQGEPIKSPKSATKKFFSLKGRKGRRSSSKRDEGSDSEGEASSTAMSPSNSNDRSQKTLSMILREADEALNGMSDEDEEALGESHHDDGSDDAFALELDDDDGIKVSGH